MFLMGFEPMPTPLCSEQFSEVHVKEIKHDHPLVVRVVLDPRYDKLYKALSRSIALNDAN